MINLKLFITKIKKILLVTILGVLLTTIYSCNCDKCEEELKLTKIELDKVTTEKVEIKKNCDACRTVPIPSPRLPKNTDLSLKIDYKNDSLYQAFQYDILNGYGILGKLKMKGSNKKEIDYIDFTLFEVGDCKRYYVEKATYLGKNNVHKIIFKISKFDGVFNPRTVKKLKLNGNKFKINTKELINMQIVSVDFPELNTPIINFSMADYGVKIFPPFICQGKIVDGSN